MNGTLESLKSLVSGLDDAKLDSNTGMSVVNQLCIYVRPSL